jgi:hypothetical protein
MILLGNQLSVRVIELRVGADFVLVIVSGIWLCDEPLEPRSLSVLLHWSAEK